MMGFIRFVLFTVCCIIAIVSMAFSFGEERQTVRNFLPYSIDDNIVKKKSSVLYRISKPGVKPSYLLGTMHPLKIPALASTLVHVIDQSDIGVFEMLILDKPDVDIDKLGVFLPHNQTLVDYLGEEMTRKTFKAIQHSEPYLMDDSFNQAILFNVDILDYDIFNRLHPKWVTSILLNILSKLETNTYITTAGSPPLPHSYILEAFYDARFKSSLQEKLLKKESAPHDQQIIETKEESISCIPEVDRMDRYIQKKFYCAGKDIFSLVNIHEEMSIVVDSELMSFNNIPLFSNQVTQFISYFESHNDREIKKIAWYGFLKSVFNIFLLKLAENYMLGLSINFDKIKTKYRQSIVSFLNKYQCAKLPEYYIDKYLENTFLVDPNIIMFSAFLEEKITNISRQDIELAEELKMKIFNSCFPDDSDTHNTDKEIQDNIFVQMKLLKMLQESLLIKKDQRMALRMMPHLQKGGALVAVGLGHVPGVLERLTSFYDIQPIDFPFTKKSSK